MGSPRTRLALPRLSLLLLLGLLLERAAGAQAVADLKVLGGRPVLVLQPAVQVVP